MRWPWARGSRHYGHPPRHPSRRPPLPASYFAPFWEETSAEIYEQLIADVCRREKQTLWAWQHHYTLLLGPVYGKLPTLEELVSAWHRLLASVLTDRCGWPVRVERPTDDGAPYLLVDRGMRATRRDVDRRLAAAGVPGRVLRASWYGAFALEYDRRPRRRLIRAWRRSTGLPLPPGLGVIGVTHPWSHLRVGGRVMIRFLEDQVFRYHSLGPSPVTAEDMASLLSSSDASLREFAYEALGRWKPRDDAPPAPRTPGAA